MKSLGIGNDTSNLLSEFDFTLEKTLSRYFSFQMNQVCIELVVGLNFVLFQHLLPLNQPTNRHCQLDQHLHSTIINRNKRKAEVEDKNKPLVFDHS